MAAKVNGVTSPAKVNGVSPAKVNGVVMGGGGSGPVGTALVTSAGGAYVVRSAGGDYVVVHA